MDNIHYKFQRDKLRTLLSSRESINRDIRRTIPKYLNTIPTNSMALYITDHAIARYLERVILHPRCEGQTDEDYIFSYHIAPQAVREQIITPKDSRYIVKNDITLYRINSIYSVIIRNLNIVTVILN